MSVITQVTGLRTNCVLLKCCLSCQHILRREYNRVVQVCKFPLSVYITSCIIVYTYNIIYVTVYHLDHLCFNMILLQWMSCVLILCLNRNLASYFDPLISSWCPGGLLDPSYPSYEWTPSIYQDLWHWAALVTEPLTDHCALHSS